jgi:hypothetical protein
MATAVIGSASIIFTAGVVAGRVSGASWRWSSVFTITNMASLGLLLYAQQRVLTTHLISIKAFAQVASITLSVTASFYLANKLVEQKPTNAGLFHQILIDI